MGYKAKRGRVSASEAVSCFSLIEKGREPYCWLAPLLIILTMRKSYNNLGAQFPWTYKKEVRTDWLFSNLTGYWYLLEELLEI